MFVVFDFITQFLLNLSSIYFLQTSIQPPVGLSKRIKANKDAPPEDAAEQDKDGSELGAPSSPLRCWVDDATVSSIAGDPEPDPLLDDPSLQTSPGLSGDGTEMTSQQLLEQEQTPSAVESATSRSKTNLASKRD